jgi:predicted nucleic acid-binding protein
MSETVFDCCVISNFALAGALDTIKELFKNKAFITDFVAAEVLRGIQSGHSRLEDILKAERAAWLKRTGLNTAGERRLFGSLSRSLGLGEASSIAVAKSRGFVFASDDRVARAGAATLGVPLTGTAGILVKAGFSSPVRSISEIVSKKNIARE